MTLSDAFARVVRVARQARFQRSSPPVVPERREISPKHLRKSVGNRVSRADLNKIRPHLRGFQKKRYQQFLKPLEMPELKIYGELPKYNAARAEANLAAKRSTDRIDIFNNYLNERLAFNKMMDFLVELTPEYLKSTETVENTGLLNSVLKEELTEFTRNKYKVPRYHFHEVPSIPQPLTRESFQEYIYFLTHLNIVYRNSSSLTSGIVSEILMYTHSLENSKFKPYRSVHTYNYLIKFYGYDKFQVSFARYLLLVMYKDGYMPNIDTINQLLKICRVNSKRRAVSSTYRVIMRYLAVAKNHDIRINLLTWNRVYDCIDNVLLKEHFVNKISAVNLPVLNNLCLQILSDYSATTKDTSDVVQFIETDLRRTNWKTDPRVADRVVYHSIINARNNNEFGDIWNGLIQEVAIDGVSLKNILNGIFANLNFNHRVYLAMRVYVELQQKADVLPEVYAKLVSKICENEDKYDVESVNRLVRKLVHIDAVDNLSLPLEFYEYESNTNSNKPITSAFPEHYRIMQRLTRHFLIDLEAKCLYVNRKYPQVIMPWKQITSGEMNEWKQQKLNIKSSEWAILDVSVLGLKPAVRNVPESYVAKYRRQAHNRMAVNHDINLVHKLEKGIDRDIEQKMRERNIYCT